MIDLRPDLLQLVTDLLARHAPGLEVRAFGSRARWTAKEHSDLDLVIMSDTPLPLETLARLEEDFSESDLPLRVDVVDWASLDDNFRRIIEQGYEVIQKAGGRWGMGSGWKKLPFDNAVVINPPVLLKRGELYPFVDMKAIDPASRYATASESRKFSGGGSRFRHGDTLMARITPCLENGKIARFWGSSDSTLGHGSTEFIVIRGRDGVTDTVFAYYLTRSDILREYAVSQMTGTSGRQRVPTSALSHITVLVPPLPEQRAIAHILGTLDDKIELNRRMNRTLEGMAQALFKAWFVDGAEAGWEVGSVLEFADLLSGGTPRTSEASYWNGDIDWVSAKDVSNAGGAFLLETEKKITQAGVDNSSTKLLPAKTTIVTARGTVGAYCMLGRAMTMNQTNYGLKAKDSVGDYFVYFTLKHLIEQLRQQSHGTIFDTITTKTFQSTTCVQPPQTIIRKFEEQVTPFMDAVLNNQEISRTLAALRDALLPKLINGELRVKDAEAFMGGVA